MRPFRLGGIGRFNVSSRDLDLVGVVRIRRLQPDPHKLATLGRDLTTVLDHASGDDSTAEIESHPVTYSNACHDL